jgi:hypothetical protein
MRFSFTLPVAPVQGVVSAVVSAVTSA